jgi:CRP-like cAMP-binding protein
VVAVESELERRLSDDIMRGGERPEIRNLPEGTELTRQGEAGDELFLVLDGIARVDVDGEALAELGPGAVLGERALLEDGVRTSTVTAVTPLRVAVASRASIDLDRLRTLAESHHREDLVESD